MPVLNTGIYRHWVDLDDPVNDGTPVTFRPARVKCAITPHAPGAFDEQRSVHVVTMRYHPQITFNTRLLHRGRYLYVRGIQNVDERNTELVLLCEEVLIP